MMSRPLTVLASSLALLLLMLTVSLADLVTLTSDATTKGAIGGQVRGTVISESPSKIEVKLGTTVTTIPTSEIVSIDYEGKPASYAQAVARESANALPEAADLYKKAAAEASSKPFVAEDALYGQARVMAEIAQTDPSRASEAVAVLESFARTYKNGRHVGPALESLVKLQISREVYSAVEPLLKELSALPKGEERATILRIKILAKKGQYDQAVSELDKIIAGSPDGSTKKRDAQLSRAENLLALKKYAEAETTVMTVIKDAATEDAATQAAAHNTLGDCLLAAGRTKEALNAYLHTHLLFNKEKDEDARALARISQIWKELNQPDRAAEALERLKTEYPRSPYATSK